LLLGRPRPDFFLPCKTIDRRQLARDRESACTDACERAYAKRIARRGGRHQTGWRSQKLSSPRCRGRRRYSVVDCLLEFYDTTTTFARAATFRSLPTSGFSVALSFTSTGRDARTFSRLSINHNAMHDGQDSDVVPSDPFLSYFLRRGCFFSVGFFYVLVIGVVVLYDRSIGIADFLCCRPPRLAVNVQMMSRTSRHPIDPCFEGDNIPPILERSRLCSLEGRRFAPTKE